MLDGEQIRNWDERATAEIEANEILSAVRGFAFQDAVTFLALRLLLAKHQGITEGIDRADRAVSKAFGGKT